MTIELACSLGLNFLTICTIVFIMVVSRSEARMLRRANEELAEWARAERRQWYLERQQLLDRVQARDTDDYATLRQVALSEDEARLSQENKEPEQPSWREAAARHPEFAQVASLISITQPESDEEMASAWIPTGIDRGYSVPLHEFFRKIGFRHT